MPERTDKFQAASAEEPPLFRTEHTVSGEVDKILFSSEDASWRVVRLHDAEGNPAVAAGDLPGVMPGQHAVFTGTWENHKEYGRRLKVRTFHVSPPVTEEGIRRYLASGLLPGIGEKTAALIVRRFGRDTLDILDSAPKRLAEIPGLGRKKIEAVRKAWKENTENRTLRIQLEGYGISPAYFRRITSIYGNDAAEKIRENPYQLADDVKGIGFQLADRIAEKAGIGKNDPKRLAAGVLYAFRQMRQTGHVCMPEDLFTESLADLLGITKAEAETAWKDAMRAGHAVRMPGPGGTAMIYEPVMMRLENELPFRIGHLLSCRNHCGIAMRSVPPLPGHPFSAEQMNAVDRAGRYAFSILTGGPGVGKTTVVSELTRRAAAAKIPVVLAAPTGRAAKRMEETTGHEASTIHRLLKWDASAGKFVHGTDLPLAKALYVIDESSMLDLLLAVALFRAIPSGACVVLVGDPDQLPSVGPGNVLNDLIDSGIAPVSRLTKIFRQGSGSGIVQAAHAVNGGRLPPRAGEAHQKDFYWIEKEDPEEAADVIERLISDRIPRRFGLDPKKDIQLLCPMNRGEAGTIAMNQRLQHLLNPEEERGFFSGERRFLIGDKVMQTVNNYDRSVFNGDLGFLEAFDSGAGTFSVRYDDRLVEYPMEDSVQLVPAYAITVHKSQGSEFPAVVMPVLSQFYRMLQRNLVYTGITRAKKLMILVGSRKAVSLAVWNSVREPRYSLLFDKLKREADLL